ncbi:type IV pilus twitching motility protein PilT [Mesoterricola silvestris]|uniref:Twitching motility protein PilT n=1 Tax=Mesoterricola silvestris TaxID=2927979 RepID=A0AA48GEQ8_9BACT|nr:type IV pilus twitching motility protein PilT [Mesoterricola silvestris]BDU71186.1 twitching motility protein PilT [Mesoterricola silvestris]
MAEPSAQYVVPLQQLLKTMVEYGGTDLHVTTDTAPQVRIDGRMVPLKLPPLEASQTRWLCYGVMTDQQKHRLEEDLEVDFSFGLQGVSRFRANVFNQKGATAGVFRAIPENIRSFEQLGLPPIAQTLCDKPRGLILVTGVTGSGKSTTLAAMIDRVNEVEPLHILTIEDPVEYVHHHKRCLVNQREVHADTHSFKKALRSALRQDPDVVLVGELRDLETIEAALTIAETGHLTFGTLHTSSCVQTMNRIIDVFPAHQQPQIRAQLSLVLEGVICQSLIPKASGKGRSLALEVMIPNPAIRNLIREDKIHQIYSSMQTGQLKFGMQTFNQSLSELVLKGDITQDMAMSYSSNQEELRELINRGVGTQNMAPMNPGKPAGQPSSVLGGRNPNIKYT